MRVKLITIFFVTFAAFLAIMVWRADQVIFTDKLSWNETGARSQLSAFTHTLEVELKSLSPSQFLMRAKIAPQEEGWEVLDSQSTVDSEIRSWAIPYVKLALKGIKKTDFKDNASLVFSILDPKRKAYLLFIHRENEASAEQWSAGILKSDLFQAMIDRQRGQLSQVYVVNSQGQVLGHLVPEYVGSLMTNEEVVQEVTKGLVSSGQGIYTNNRNEKEQSLFEQVARSNVFVVISTPVAALLKNRSEIQFQFILLGLGLLMVSLAAFIMFYKPEKEPSSRGGTLAAAKVAMAPVSSDEKISTFSQVAATLAQELKGPLTSILGHAQLAQKDDSNVEEHVQRIESEARASRDVIQKLLTFAGEQAAKVERASISSVVSRALKAVEGPLLSKGIKINKQLNSAQEFVMSTELVGRAIEAVLRNAIEAMDRAPKKELIVSLCDNDDKVELMIADSGEGISPENRDKVFDPFFTTKGSQHMGLGLPTAMGILREMNAQISVQSEIGLGTTVMMSFAPEIQNSLSESQMAMPKELPPAPAEEIRALDERGAREGKLTTPVSPIIVDHSIEDMIDENLDIESSTAFTSFDIDMPPPTPVTPEMLSGFSAKVDRPQVNTQKRNTKLDQLDIPVRKPGATI